LETTKQHNYRIVKELGKECFILQETTQHMEKIAFSVVVSKEWKCNKYAYFYKSIR